MKIEAPSRQNRRKRKLELYKQFARDWKNGTGLSVAQIAAKYTNPKTGKPYTKVSVWRGLQEVDGMSI